MILLALIWSAVKYVVNTFRLLQDTHLPKWATTVLIASRCLTSSHQSFILVPHCKLKTKGCCAFDGVAPKLLVSFSWFLLLFVRAALQLKSYCTAVSTFLSFGVAQLPKIYLRPKTIICNGSFVAVYSPLPTFVLHFTWRSVLARYFQLLDTDGDVFMPIKCVFVCTAVSLWNVIVSACFIESHTKVAACWAW